MSIMVDKETCVEAINKFIKSKSIKDAAVLLNYLCEIKDLPNKEEAINALNNPALISMFIPQILDELEKYFNLVRVADKNNTILLVY